MKRKYYRPGIDTLEPRICLTEIAFAVRVIENRQKAPSWVATPDLDQDGDLDILAAFPERDEISWYENVDGLGTFARRFIGEGGEPLAVFAVDIDGDSDLDVVVGSSKEVILAWFENTDGRGTFDAKESGWGNVVLNAFGTVDRLRGVAAFPGDVDGDGDVDLMASFGGSRDGIEWFENTDGRGTFGPGRSVSATSVAQALELVDLDGDHDLDVVVAIWEEQTVAWHENVDSKGTFGERVVLSDDDDPLNVSPLIFPRVVAVDLDQDGDRDVVATLPWQNTIAWYENVNGDGIFSGKKVLTSEAAGPSAMSMQDLDADGDLDLILMESPSTPGKGRVTWYRHLDGKGSFGPRRIVADTSTLTGAVHAADIDADGDLDILLATTFDDVIVIFEQRTLGDANDDGLFDSADLVEVFQAGEYEDERRGNSSFEEGDWTGDGDFTTADLVFAFQAGGYQQAASLDLSMLSDIAAVQQRRQPFVS